MLSYSFEEMYAIGKNCDESYNGKFFVAVKTTKIFCIPSCKAKFPLPENLEFFETKDEALQAGYRGCKRCYSDNWPFNDPNWLGEVVTYLKKHSNRKVDLEELTALAKVDQTTLRRYFKKKYQQSLMDYHRSLRLEQAEILLKEKTISEVAQLCGFSTVKGFTLAYRKKYGKKPVSNHFKNNRSHINESNDY